MNHFGNYKHTQMHGFHIASCEMSHLESVSIGIFIPVGSRHELAKESGVAHFTEHMIFKGTKNRSALDLAVAIEGSGGTINAYTTEDQTCLETRGPAEFLPHFLEVMSDMLWNSTFLAHEIKRECEVISEEIIMYQENPADHLHDLLSQALWPNHPLGRPITGSEITIKDITQSTLESFTRRHYYNKGITVSVAGNIAHLEVIEACQKYLPETQNTYNSFEKFINHQTSFDDALVHDRRNIEQVHLAIGFHTAGRHSIQRHVIRMLSLLMGETISSRLFQELREKRGLCYHIASDFSLYEDTGTFEIHAGIDSKRVDETLQAINAIIKDILKHGFTEKELAQAKKFASGQARIELETAHAQMMWMGDSVTSFGTIINPVEARTILSSVTLKQLDELARNIFINVQPVIASIGPHSHGEMKELLKNLDFSIHEKAVHY